MRRRALEARGFSLVEMLVSVGIMLAVTAGVFTVVNPARGTFQAQPELADMQQRLRVIADSLFKDLVGAGADIHFFAPVLPMRRGLVNADPPGIFKASTITLLSVQTPAAQTSTSQGMAGPSSDLSVNAEPGCPPTDRLCGFSAGMNAVIYDDTGAYDTFTIAAVDSATLTIVRTPAPLSKAYEAGARVTQAASVTYWLNAPANQLMRYDGVRSDAAAADNVVAVNFEYYGEPQPPSLKNPGTDESVTYGPPPPEIDRTAGPFWPAGESCTIQLAGEEQTPRLAVLGSGTTLVKLDPAMLTDGPWCPDPANPNRWDADLLRIRKIFVTIRVRSVFTTLRLPDQEIRFEVAPRNLNLER
jgi:Tfp pilus assembly protein PilW